MEKKWFYEIPERDACLYRPDEVIVGYDRLNGVFITLDQIFFVYPSNLKDSRIKDKWR